MTIHTYVHEDTSLYTTLSRLDVQAMCYTEPFVTMYETESTCEPNADFELEGRITLGGGLGRASTPGHLGRIGNGHCLRRGHF
jgi:hypothetical protein